MKPVLLIDFGSTYTKVTAVDVDEARLIGSAAAYTTVETDINDGLDNALARLEQKVGKLDFAQRFACSSAAGGLRMVTVGLVPSLTAEAARLASLGAGAKVIRVYAYELTEEDVEEIAAVKPDILLLTGGTDGGNKACITHNAELIASCKADFPVIYAGNRSCASQCVKLLEGREVIKCPNVMPRMNELNITPVQEEIRELFLRQIIKAKGLSKASELVSGILMPTPSSVLRAMELLSEGTKNQSGIGDLVGIDPGGATTDVYSIALGLPEPKSKRTVEGDIGVRYSVHGIVDACGLERVAAMAGLGEERCRQLVDYLSTHTDTLPDTEELKNLDYALASGAVETAVTRHAGRMEQVYTNTGPVLVQQGKNLCGVRKIIITGGSVIHSGRAHEIAAHGLFNEADAYSLKPKQADIYVDRRYILSAMGILAENYPDVALTIMKKELEKHGA